MPKLIDNSPVRSAPFAGMLPGETRTHIFPDGTAKTITRTKRPFMHDWVEATNDELAAKGSSYRWVFKDGPHLTPTLVDKKFIRETR